MDMRAQIDNKLQKFDTFNAVPQDRERMEKNSFLNKRDKNEHVNECKQMIELKPSKVWKIQVMKNNRLFISA